LIALRRKKAGKEPLSGGASEKCFLEIGHAKIAAARLQSFHLSREKQGISCAGIVSRKARLKFVAIFSAKFSAKYFV